VVIAEPDELLQVAGRLVGQGESAEAVAFGAQVVGQLVAVTGVGLGSAGSPTGAGGVERVGVDRTTGCPAARSRSTSSPFDVSMATGRSPGSSWPARRARVRVMPVSSWVNAHRSMMVAVSSMMVRSWVSLAQSRPT